MVGSVTVWLWVAPALPPVLIVTTLLLDVLDRQVTAAEPPQVHSRPAVTEGRVAAAGITGAGRAGDISDISDIGDVGGIGGIGDAARRVA